MTDDRPLTLRRLAARVASHPRIEQAVMAGIRSVLPDVLEDMLGEMANDGGGTVRLYRRKHPKAKRIERDNRIRSMLGAGAAPRAISDEVRCSLAHVYTIRQRWISGGGKPGAAPTDAEEDRPQPLRPSPAEAA